MRLARASPATGGVPRLPPGTRPPMTRAQSSAPAGRLPTRASGLLLGLGLGGFVDGIVLHQLLQWHHMVSSVKSTPMTTLAGLEANTLADGVFHVASWLLTLAGILTALVAWQQGRIAPSWSFQIGLVLAGWGMFDLVEGIVDHQILGVHHVRDDLGAPLSWDIGFLVFGGLLVACGWLLHRRGLHALREVRGRPLGP
jgi:uncharacterized membrane protein